eukprot:TRINITY_DN4267_c0_g1_i1.p1 TRINITY_DN4267_c0_g1~~TRINITY_DN4267_c0_g1_i1.p1  ORF type:complete len:282 (+),score=35.50 TRINITY_DN4267_c0_g1_i1:111-848(+)
MKLHNNFKAHRFPQNNLKNQMGMGLPHFPSSTVPNFKKKRQISYNHSPPPQPLMAPPSQHNTNSFSYFESLRSIINLETCILSPNRLYLITDIDCFLLRLDKINQLKKLSPMLSLVVPFSVLVEISNLQKADDKIGYNAQEALHFIQEELQFQERSNEETPWLLLQKNPPKSALTQQENDESILNCAHTLMQNRSLNTQNKYPSEASPTRIILLTTNFSLMIKALGLGIATDNIHSFVVEHWRSG